MWKARTRSRQLLQSVWRPPDRPHPAPVGPKTEEGGEGYEREPQPSRQGNEETMPASRARQHAGLTGLGGAGDRKTPRQSSHDAASLVHMYSVSFTESKGATISGWIARWLAANHQITVEILHRATGRNNSTMHIFCVESRSPGDSYCFTGSGLVHRAANA